jgi:hypothetical protein
LQEQNLQLPTLNMSSPPFKVKAVFEYTSPHEDDLHFPFGQIITVTEEEDEDWYAGEYVDASGVKQEGIFPRNFVEKFEPTAPPRPARTNRPKKDAESAREPSPAPPTVNLARKEDSQRHPEPLDEAPITREPPPPAPKHEVAAPPPQPVVSKPAPSKASAPPPVNEKPTGNSFKDRIAAFNKATPPPAPFKPGGLGGGGSSNFIKKPFVAPPPSKNAYVPTVPREPAQQPIYRREEDPEIAERESEHQAQAEKAGLAPAANEDNGEGQPKPTSLKERIALLQKQQMEQASRHADAAQKKEKPKKPAKKRIEASSATEGLEGGEGAALERTGTEETLGKPSMDSTGEDQPSPRRRKSSKGAPTTPSLQPRKSFGDGNEADVSGANDTNEEIEEISTGKDDTDEKPRARAPQPPSRAPTAPVRQPDVGEEEGAAEESDEGQNDEDEDEDEEMDPEARRKEELRARMAKMSGGMGMYGMFGPPAGIGMPVPPKKRKSTGMSEQPRSAEHGQKDTASEMSSAPPMPMISMPGMQRVQSPEEHEEEHVSISSSRPAEEVPDVEDVILDQSRGPPPPGMGLYYLLTPQT